MNKTTSLVFTTFFSTLVPFNRVSEGSNEFTGLIAYTVSLITLLIVIGAVLFGPKDGLCCELCNFCWIGCYRGCCKRRKDYAETLDRKIREWKEASEPGLLSEEYEN